MKTNLRGHLKQSPFPKAHKSQLMINFKSTDWPVRFKCSCNVTIRDWQTSLSPYKNIISKRCPNIYHIPNSSFANRTGLQLVLGATDATLWNKALQSGGGWRSSVANSTHIESCSHCLCIHSWRDFRSSLFVITIRETRGSRLYDFHHAQNMP